MQIPNVYLQRFGGSDTIKLAGNVCVRLVVVHDRNAGQIIDMALNGRYINPMTVLVSLECELLSFYN